MRLLQLDTIKSAIIMVAILFQGVISAKSQQVIEMDSLIRSNSSGFENSLTGSIAGLHVKNWTGTPGIQSLINLRGLAIDGSDATSMPLIMVNGVPLVANPSSITNINPLSYFSPDQIERVEVYKNIADLTKLGVQAPNGAINIITKEGENGPLHVRVSSFAGVNISPSFGDNEDGFYNHNSKSREKVYTNSLIHEENVTIDGGGNYGSYFFGINNHMDQSIVDGVDFDRQSLFFNAKYNITDKFTTSFYNNLTLAARDGRYSGDYVPTLNQITVEDEKFFMDKNRNIGLVSSIDLVYAFSSNLKLSSLVGMSYEGSRRDLYIPSNLLSNEVYALSAAYKRQSLSVNTRLDFNKQLSDALKLDLSIGNEVIVRESRLTKVNGQKPIEAGGSDFVKVVKGFSSNQTNAMSDYINDKLVSFYGTGSLDFNEALKANVVVRLDGSSLYKDKWEVYPAVGLEYNMAKSMNLPLSINASIGKTGQLSRPEVYRGQLIAYGNYYNDTELGIGQLYKPFEDAKSISIDQIDAGINYEIIKGLVLSAQYYSKKYSDFTYLRYLPNIQGIDYEYETGYGVNLTGYEFALSGNLINKNTVKWYCNINLALQNNEVDKVPSKIENTSLEQYTVLKEGDTFTSHVVYENGQQVVIGDKAAELFGGFNSIFTVGNLSLSTKLTFASGADIVAESHAYQLKGNGSVGYIPQTVGTPYYYDKLNKNGEPVYQGVEKIYDGAFFRINTVALGYNLSSLVENSMTFSDIQIYLQGDNLLTLTEYSGFNPEENIHGVKEVGLGSTGTPLPMSVTLGLKLKF